MQRLIDCQKGDVREVIQIVELLNSYAQYASGAAHLYRQNILTHLLQNQCVAEIANAQFYSKDADQQSSRDASVRRDPYSILWCHILLLIRSLNMHLLEDDGYTGAPISAKQDDMVMNQEAMRIDPQTYLKSLLHFL